MIKPYVMLKHPSLKIAVIGWITPETAYMSSAGDTVTFKPIVPSVKACIAQLRKEQKDVDLIIGLSHSGARESSLTTAAA